MAFSHYKVCPSCAVVVSNGDTSHIEDELTLGLVTMRIEDAPMLSHLGTMAGVIQCDLCYQWWDGDYHLYLYTLELYGSNEPLSQKPDPEEPMRR